jgi:hypothetical protein
MSNRCELQIPSRKRHASGNPSEIALTGALKVKIIGSRFPVAFLSENALHSVTTPHLLHRNMMPKISFLGLAVWTGNMLVVLGLF